MDVWPDDPSPGHQQNHHHCRDYFKAQQDVANDNAIDAIDAPRHGCCTNCDDSYHRNHQVAPPGRFTLHAAYVEVCDKQCNRHKYCHGWAYNHPPILAIALLRCVEEIQVDEGCYIEKT